MKSVTFRQKNLPMSEKSSTFACFFAARVRASIMREGKKEKLTNKIINQN